MNTLLNTLIGDLLKYFLLYSHLLVNLDTIDIGEL